MDDLSIFGMDAQSRQNQREELLHERSRRNAAFICIILVSVGFWSIVLAEVIARWK
jgi:cell division protein FtsB